MTPRQVPLPFALLGALVVASACGSTAETSVNVTGPTVARCQPALASQTTSFGPGGGTGTVAVTVARECTWTASATAPWIVLTGGQEGQGDGTVAYRISENADPVTRRGGITVAEQTVQLAQEAAPCRFRVSGGDTTVPAAGGELSIDVGTHNVCNWTASTSAAWVSPSPPSGSGTATIRVHVEPNTGQLRSADVMVAGQRVTVSQDPRSAAPPPAPPTSPVPPPPGPPAPCNYQLTDGAAAFEAQGGLRTVSVHTASTCSWTARSNASWVTITGSAAGNGTAEIRYTVAENFSTSSRSTTITVATEVLRIAQDRADEMELEGRISGLSGSCPNLRFTVDGRTVTTDRDTTFREGKCSNARNGERVTVWGMRQSNGTIDARRVEFDD
jgi:hypothetical protein